MSLQRYCAPASIDEAVALLAGQGGARVFAGGSDLLVQMRSGVRSPEALIDLKRIPGLVGVSIDVHGARIGASTCCAEIAGHGGLRAVWPGLVEAAALIGSKQVQGRASLGGNLCNASPAADAVPALVVNRATAVVAGPDGLRRIPVAEVPAAPGQTALGTGEFVLAFEIPHPDPRTADAYLRFIPRTEMDIAVAGAAVSISLDGNGRCVAARVAIGAVAPTVLEVGPAGRALEGSFLDEAALRNCVAAIRAAARPIDDRRGSATFRRHVVGVLVQRAVAVAAARAAGKGGN